jgi:hypothetical protein
LGRVLQIPLPGGSGAAPTGAVQFRDDWPGLFVRGDDAIALLREFREIQRTLEAHRLPYLAMKLEEIAGTIERDVVAR